MSMSGTTVEYSFSQYTRRTTEWADLGPTQSWRLNAEVYAAKEGSAGCVLAEGGLMFFYRSANQIKSRYWPVAIERKE